MFKLHAQQASSSELFYLVTKACRLSGLSIAETQGALAFVPKSSHRRKRAILCYRAILRSYRNA